MSEVRERPPWRPPFDGGPTIHQGFCRLGGEGEGHGEDEGRGGDSALIPAESGRTIWVQAQARGEEEALH